MTVEEAKEILEEVLSRNEEKSFGLPDWLTRALDSVQKWLRRILDDIMDFLGKILEKIAEFLGKIFKDVQFSPGSGGNAGNVVRIIATVIIAALFLALMAAVVLFVRRTLKRVKAKPKMADADAMELEELVSRPDDGLMLAEKHLNLGQIAEAFRYLVLSLLVQMNLREVIAVRIYKTNRMYRAEMIASGVVREEEITPLFRKFNAVRFGRHPITRAEYDAFRAQYDRLLQDVDARLAANGKRGKAGKS